MQLCWTHFHVILVLVCLGTFLAFFCLEHHVLTFSSIEIPVPIQNRFFSLFKLHFSPSSNSIFLTFEIPFFSHIKFHFSPYSNAFSFSLFKFQFSPYSNIYPSNIHQYVDSSVSHRPSLILEMVLNVNGLEEPITDLQGLTRNVTLFRAMKDLFIMDIQLGILDLALPLSRFMVTVITIYQHYCFLLIKFSVPAFLTVIMFLRL